MAAPPRTSLATLVTEIPVEGLAQVESAPAVLAYVDLLDRVLEDRRLTTEEVDALRAMAVEWGLGSSQVFAIHRAYFGGLARLALADGVITELEREDLILMAGLLGVPDAVFDLRAAASGLAVTATRLNELRGKSVCFTGESVCKLNGVPLDRSRQQRLAAGAGLVPVDSVTKHLDILVLADPSSLSGKAKKADQYGVRKMGERALWAALGVSVDGS